MSNNSGNSSSKPSGPASGAPDKNNGGVKSISAIVKEGWGSRPNFQHSYGLGSMEPIATLGSWYIRKC